MANRYLISGATGDWHNTANWSTTSHTGGSGASVPTASDIVILSNDYSGSVSLSADAECLGITTSGVTNDAQSVNLNGKKLHVYSSITSLYSGAGNAFINIANSTLEVDGTIDAAQNLTNISSSFIILNINTTSTFGTSTTTYGDVRINLSGTNETLTITNSPTFRLLDIRSANSASHTVMFDNDIVISQKFIGIGSSSSNRLKLDGGDSTPINFNFTAANDIVNLYSCYGENLDVEDIAPQSFYEEDVSKSRLYIGSSSIKNWTGSSEWVLSNPPKISTLIDPLTTSPSSNTNWTNHPTYTTLPSLTNTGYDGGGYNFEGSGGKGMVSRGTFDIYDSEVVFEFPEEITAENLVWYVTSLISPRIYGQATSSYVEAYYEKGDDYYSASTLGGPPKWIKLGLTTGRVLRAAFSDDGVTWGSYHNIFTIAEDDIPLLRSNRISFYKVTGTGGGLTLGSINSSATPPEPTEPSVTTNAATSIGETSATLNGNITSDGDESITQHGFIYGTDPTLTSGTTTTTLGSGSEGTYDDGITGLSNITTYYFRAYATNSEGTGYGGIESFVTLAPPPPPSFLKQNGRFIKANGKYLKV